MMWANGREPQYCWLTVKGGGRRRPSITSSGSNSMPTLCGIRMPEKAIHAAWKLEKPLSNDSHPFGGNLVESNRFQGELANSQQQKDISPCCEPSHHPLVCVLNRSAVSHSLGPHGLYYPPGHLCPHGIFQARILEWVAISYSRESSRPRDGTCISCISSIGRWILYH